MRIYRERVRTPALSGLALPSPLLLTASVSTLPLRTRDRMAPPSRDLRCERHRCRVQLLKANVKSTTIFFFFLSRLLSVAVARLIYSNIYELV